MANRTKNIDTTWSADLAYAIGIIASDGNLSPDMRHINLTSKDKEIVDIFKKILKLSNKIGRKARGGSSEKKYYVIQFGSKNFYEFLLSIGLTPAKSKTIAALKIPERYFADFLRGCIDGDGNINEFIHPESTNMQLRVCLSSASPLFLAWIYKKIVSSIGAKGGWVRKDKRSSVSNLTFGKADSIKILKALYRRQTKYFLKRKHKTATTYL